MRYLLLRSLLSGSRLARLAVLAAATVAAPAPVVGQIPVEDHWKLVDEGLGRGGTTQPDGVRRYSFPRSDLQVQLDGVAIRPALALGSWLAFQPMGKDAMVMGDLVLTHEEVNPVMTELLRGGIKITALHNHLLRSSPATMYMHVQGHGEPWNLALALRTALAKSRTPLARPSAAAGASLDFDTASLDRIMERQGKSSGGIYQYVVPRRERPTDSGMAAGETMGTGTVLNFQPTGGDRAAVTGDFVLSANEVDAVMRILRGSNIEVTALHNHMLADEPRLFFMHFWGHDNAQSLARGLRAALASTAAK
jgi:hypothetical protein